MIECGSAVVAAVSGGSDSMALLFALKSISDDYGFALCAAHVNHCIRGNDAERDENFVRQKCEELGVELFVKKADVVKMASEQGIGLEECGRNVRYEFFNSLGDNIVIATAHNLSARAETFLFNFARGSALRGLCSIPPVRDNIIRPLIECSKEEILDFCQKNARSRLPLREARQCLPYTSSCRYGRKAALSCRIKTPLRPHTSEAVRRHSPKAVWQCGWALWSRMRRHTRFFRLFRSICLMMKHKLLKKRKIRL